MTKAKTLRRVREGSLPEGVVSGRVVRLATRASIKPPPTAPVASAAAPPLAGPFRCPKDDDEPAKRTNAIQGVVVVLPPISVASSPHKASTSTAFRLTRTPSIRHLEPYMAQARMKAVMLVVVAPTLRTSSKGEA